MKSFARNPISPALILGSRRTALNLFALGLALNLGAWMGGPHGIQGGAAIAQSPSASSPMTVTAPKGGERLVSPESADPSKLNHYVAGGLKKEKQVIDLEPTSIEGFDAKQALSLSVFDQPRNTWDASISVGTDAPVAKGDRVLVGFWVRGQALDESGNAIADDGGVVEVVFEKRSPPHTKSVQYLVETLPGNQWKHVWVRCESQEAYGAGESGMSFQMGYRPQTIEVAGVEIWKYPADRSLDTLPMSPRTYVGREADAAWRTAAAKRIDQHRKCNLTVTLVDRDGKPVVDQPVQIQQTGHAFRFGTAVSVDMLGRQDEDGKQYREQLTRLFNTATIENGLKWGAWDRSGSDRHAQVLSAVDWLNEQSMAVRGHVMVWPAQKNSPKWISSVYDTPETLNKVVKTHIREMAYATKGRVADWDVVNEAFDNREFEAHLGPQCFSEFFREARGVLPDTDLYYNDYAGLVRAGVNTYHKDHFEEIITRLKSEGAPIDGIGIQGHFGEILTPPHRLVRELDRWGKFDLKILITEFDVGVPDQALMADFTGDFLTACFSHPAVDGIMTWGFWSGSHWRPESALFDGQWQPTALGKRWIELTEKKWMTDVACTTDASGEATERVFKGDYEIRAGGQTWNVSAEGDQSITLKMK